LFTVTIVLEGFVQEFEFLWKTVGITDKLGLGSQGGEHSLSVSGMVMK
jgi:type II secretory pathway component HofQ